jgi:hypothetical protein
MISNYSDLLQFLEVELGGCPVPLLTQTLQKVGRQFCEDTEAWRETLTFNRVANQADYVLTPTWSAEIRRIISVKTHGDTMNPDLHESWYEFEPSTNTLTMLSPATDAQTDGMVVKIVLVPWLITQELEGWFMGRWANALINGTKAELMLMKNKSWTSLDRAPFFSQEYNKDVAKARIELSKSGKRKETQVYFKRFV